jgi:hypothetical protein
MTKKVLVTLLVALALPAAALATNIGNARLTVHSPKHVGNAWVGSASLVAPSAETLQLQVCIQSKVGTTWGTIPASCRYVNGHKASLATATKKTSTSASVVRTWAWAEVAKKYIIHVVS